MYDVAEIGRQRYQIKRDAGISAQRKDGSFTSAETDINAAAAESYAAEQMGLDFDARVTKHGDGGVDLTLPIRIDVVWMGVDKRTGKPRETGHLIINPDEPQRWSDIYLVVKGSVETGFDILGWTTHNELVRLPKRNFGYGEKFAMPTHRLRPISELIALRMERTV